MTGHNVDFMWLTEGRTIDHTTICKFRTRFKKQLKALFRGLGRLAMTMGLIRLGEVTFDGTRVKANNGRYETWTAAEVEKRLAELEAEFGQALEESERVDAAEEERFGLQSPPALPPELADAKARQQRLLEAQRQLAAADAARRGEGIKTPAQLPSTDSDSTVLPNKEGGYAPIGRWSECERAEYRRPGTTRGRVSLAVGGQRTQGGRTITRDRFTPDRERHAAKMQQPEARTRYARRFHAGETPFGWLKHVLGLRQFLLRGLEKVRMEWLWACTGYNLRKLILAVGRLRAEFAALATEEGN